MFLNLNHHSNFLRFHTSVKLVYSVKMSCFFLYSSFGIFILRMPSKYFYLKDADKISIMFLKSFFFKSFLKQLKFLSTRLRIFYFFKLRIRGLGFRIRNICDTMYYFFFNYTNFFYLYPPKLLLVRVYKKRMLLLSYDWFLLKLVLSHILLLRKIGPYNFLGLRFKRQIILLKKSGKKV
jgi:hypothetical protein